MNNLTHKKLSGQRRAYRVRSRITGSAERPRLSVNISNLNVTAQLVNDRTGTSLAYVTTVGQKIPGTMTEKAAWVGDEIAGKAKKIKVTKVVFDRGKRLYHGRAKALADAARKGGLEF